MSIFGDYNPVTSLQREQPEYTHASDHDTNERLAESIESRSFIIFTSVIIIFFLILIGRLLILQVAEGASNLTLAEGNRIRTRLTTAPRGIIFDRSKSPLVKNIAHYDLVFNPADLPVKKADREEVYKEVREKTKIDISGSVETIEKKGIYSLEPVVIKDNLSQEEAVTNEVLLHDLSGVQVRADPFRQYLSDKGLGHVLGYVGKISEEEYKKNKDYKLVDSIGKVGLEKTYESNLKGKDGQDQIEIDARGRLQRIIASFPSTQGDDVILNLDLPLQETTYNVLKAKIEEKKVSHGAAIAMNPKTGAVYAYVSIPDYDPNIFLSGDRKKISDLFTNNDKPLLNRPISGLYPSGSSIKPMYAAAGLQENAISPTLSVDTPRELRIGDFSFPDWKDHGVTDIRRAIAESNNIFFYGIGGGWDKIKGLGIKKLDDYLLKFGFGDKTGIDLPGEVAGFVPTPEWKKQTKKENWYIGDTYHLSIGQGDLAVTPIELLTAASSIFNEGKVVQPQLVKSIVSASGDTVKENNSVITRETGIKKENLQIVKEGMRQTVESGSARSLNTLTYADGRSLEACGKTGTAQTGKGDSTHAWFIGCAPWNDPQVVLLVLIEDGGEGSEAAVPVAREMFKTFFRADSPLVK